MNRKIILGTAQFGLEYGINNINGKPSQNQVFKILEYAAGHGVNILDTADAYGNATNLIGKFNRINPGCYNVNIKFRKSELSLREQLQTSLGLLALNQINVYFYHSFKDFKLYPGLLDELISLKNEKLIRKTGLSIYENNEFDTAIETTGIDVVQIPFNLLDNYLQRGKLLKKARENGKEIQARSIFLQSLFFKPIEDIPEKLSALMPGLTKIRTLAITNNLSIEQLALSYVIQQPEIDYAIIGIDNVNQLKRDLHFTENVLSTEILQIINKIKVKEVDLLYPKNWNR